MTEYFCQNAFGVSTLAYRCFILSAVGSQIVDSGARPKVNPVSRRMHITCFIRRLLMCVMNYCHRVPRACLFTFVICNYTPLTDRMNQLYRL
jgi:hypothetical protein